MICVPGEETRRKENETMASYTLEDVELLRKKSGISYEEAISLLDYHNGDVARVLADLEKKGRLKEESFTRTAEPRTEITKNGGSKVLNFIQKMYRTRIKVKKGETTIVNLSVLFMALAVLIFSPHLAILSLLLGLILGYRITIDKDDEAFREDKVDVLVKNAAENVKQAVSGISREIGNAVEKKKAEGQAAAEKTRAASEEGKARKQAAADPAKESAPCIVVTPAPEKDMNAELVKELEKQEKGPDVPVMQVPVRTESTDGNVEVYEDTNGYHTASIG